MTNFRPSWDDYFMAVARIIAARSTCDRLRVGAVLVKNNRIVSTGYNGSPPGLPHCDGLEGHLMEEGHCVRSVHAEHNAILQSAITGGTGTKNSTLYTLYSPCIHCSKYVVAAGVKRIVVEKIYRNNQVKEYLEKAGVEFELYKPHKKWYKMICETFNNDIEEKEAPKVVLN